MNSKLVSGVTEFLNTEEELREVILKLPSAQEAVFVVRRKRGKSNKLWVVWELWLLSWNCRPVLKLGSTRMRSRLQKHLSA